MDDCCYICGNEDSPLSTDEKGNSICQECCLNQEYKKEQNNDTKDKGQRC